MVVAELAAEQAGRGGARARPGSGDRRAGVAGKLQSGGGDRAGCAARPPSASRGRDPRSGRSGSMRCWARRTARWRSRRESSRPGSARGRRRREAGEALAAEWRSRPRRRRGAPARTRPRNSGGTASACAVVKQRRAQASRDQQCLGTGHRLIHEPEAVGRRQRSTPRRARRARSTAPRPAVIALRSAHRPQAIDEAGRPLRAAVVGERVEEGVGGGVVALAGAADDAGQRREQHERGEVEVRGQLVQVHRRRRAWARSTRSTCWSESAPSSTPSSSTPAA